MDRRKIDHLVYGVFDLEKAIDTFEERLGIRPVFGGYHKTQGTKNALLHLGDACYLELLAIDHKNVAIKAPRWMGIDLLDQPGLCRWALKSNRLNQDSAILKELHPQMGHISRGERKMENGELLVWNLIMPLANPAIEIVPFMVDWQGSNHPTNNLPEQCQLKSLLIAHPNPTKYEPTFGNLGLDIRIEKAEEICIQAQISGPKGMVEI